MTNSITTTTAATSTTGTAGSPSAVVGEGNVPPRVVRHRPTGRLVALVVAVCLAVAAAVAAASWISAHREAAPEVPVVGAAPAAVAAVGDASHGGPGSRADAVRFVPPRQDDRAVLAHGGSGRVVSGFGASRAQLS